MDRNDRVEVVASLGAELGEGPVWDARSGRVVWVDIGARRVHRTGPDGSTTSLATPLDVGAVAPRATGGFVAALRDGFWVIDDGPARRIATVAEARPGLRFNDGKCGPGGRFWAGTIADDETPGAACLYRLDPDGVVVRALDGVSVSNGLAWSGDGTTMYYIDTPTRRIDAFSHDPSTGRIDARRAVLTVPTGEGLPDGMTIDADGGLWVAMWGGWAVRRYLDGRLDRVVAMPVSQPTSCTFGGPGLDELYVTSAWKGLDDRQRREEPRAGSLFRLRPGVRGLPPIEFAG